MTKPKLVKAVADKANISQKEAERFMDSLFSNIVNALEKDDSVIIRGFGSFSVKHCKERTGRNPHTGESIKVVAKDKVYFKPSEALTAQFNQNVREH